MATSELKDRWWKRLQVHLAGVPVFLYHRITSGTDGRVTSRERKYWVSRAQLCEHLKRICDLQCETLRLEDLLSGLSRSDTRLATVVTFDDGTSSDYDVAYPILLERGIPAHFFINTSTVGMPSYLTWAQINEMQRSGMSFQSHSHDHVYLTRLPLKALKRQMEASKKTIEDRIGCPVDFLSAPYGDFNAAVLTEAINAGYKAVCTSGNWPAKANAQVVHRVAVYRSTGSGTFQHLLVGSSVVYAARAARSAALEYPKQVWVRFHTEQISLSEQDTSQ